AGITAGKAGGDILHGAVPATGLFAETMQRIVGRSGTALGQQLRPPVQHLLPIGGIVAALRRAGTGLAQRVAPGAEILPGQVFEAGIVAAAVFAHACRSLTAWGCAASC